MEIFGARIDQSLLTTPSKIVVAGVQMIWSGELWNYLAPSLVVGDRPTLAAVGVLVGCCSRGSVLDVALGVYITFLYSIPLALVPLIVLWAGLRPPPRSSSCSCSLLPMVINTYQGVKNVDPNRPRSAVVPLLGMVMWKNIVLPGALPFIVTGPVGARP